MRAPRKASNQAVTKKIVAKKAVTKASAKKNLSLPAPPKIEIPEPKIS